MKQCGKCREWKPAAEFWIKNPVTQKRSTVCKMCSRVYCRDHYKRWKPQFLARKRVRDLAYRDRNRKYVLEYLLSHPCIDCGEPDPIVLDFDHVRDKIQDVSVMVPRVGLALLALEIEKCVVRCANCHRRKTSIERGWFKSIPVAKAK